MQDNKALELFESPPKPKAKAQKKDGEDDTHRVRRRSVAGKQRLQVFKVLRDAYPHPVSHALICKKVKTNRASHRIRELIQDGWQIEGAGILGLDAGSQTQLYRLSSLERGQARLKFLGMKVLWNQEGLRVTLHRDIDDVIDPHTLQTLARKVETLVRAELGERIGKMDYEVEVLDAD